MDNNLLTLIENLIEEVAAITTTTPSILSPVKNTPTANIIKKNMSTAAKTLRDNSQQNKILKQEKVNQIKTKSHNDLVNAQKKVSQLQEKYKVTSPTVKF